MTYVVGYSPHKDDGSALELACQFARSEPAPVHAVTVVPSGWATPVAAGDTDRAFREWAAAEGEASAAYALEQLAGNEDVEVSASWVTGRSVPQRLLEEAARLDARLLVVGSGDDSADGQLALTSKTGRLVRSSGVPVAIAPSGYRSAGAKISRVTVAFVDDDESWSLLSWISRICGRVDASLRVVTFAVTPKAMATNSVSWAETQVFDHWLAQAEAAQTSAAAHLAETGFAADKLELAVATGSSWRTTVNSIDWGAGDLLVVGSSATQPLTTVFLGSSATKILRASPVPVVIVP